MRRNSSEMLIVRNSWKRLELRGRINKISSHKTCTLLSCVMMHNDLFLFCVEDFLIQIIPLAFLFCLLFLFNYHQGKPLKFHRNYNKLKKIKKFG